MDTITEVNTRFKIAVNEVIKNSLAKNKSAIAEKLQISKSRFSEILNDRMNVGVEVLVNFCLEFNVNANWLLFERGEIFNVYNSEKTLNKAAEPIDYYALKKEVQRMQKELQNIQEKLK